MVCNELRQKAECFIICAFRFVVSGNAMLAAAVPGSAKVFKFDEEYKLSAAEVNADLPFKEHCRGPVLTRSLTILCTESRSE